MTIDRRLVAAALGGALLVAACGGSPASTAPTATSPASASPRATDQRPSGSPQPSGPEVSLQPGSAPELEAMLPDRAGGVAFTKTSYDGASIPGSGTPIDPTVLGPLLATYGRSLKDVGLAMATTSDTATGQPAMVMAFQIRGVPATKWLADLSPDTASMTSTTISGKQVLQAGGGGFSVIVYTRNDVLFEILLASDAVARAIVAALP